MLINWANLGAIIALLTFVIMLIRSLIVTPMKEAIADLKMSVQHLDEVITNQRERIAKVEASSASAHRRLDELTRKIGYDNER